MVLILLCCRVQSDIGTLSSVIGTRENIVLNIIAVIFVVFCFIGCKRCMVWTNSQQPLVDKEWPRFCSMADLGVVIDIKTDW